MNLKKIPILTVLVALILVPSIVYGGKTIRLYKQDVSSDIDLAQYLAGNGITVVNGLAGDQKVVPGPAPDPYPQVYVWEQGIEQLGQSSQVCDGIRLINGNLWVVHKKALVLWTIKIPQASMRLPSEFEKDLTLSFWVDWNQDKMWGKNEKVLCENINLQQYFPTTEDYLVIEYLTEFWVLPGAENVGNVSGGAADYSVQLWVRGVLSYDDPDASPDGESLFGEAEDYLVTYFNQKDQPKINAK